MRPPLDVLLDRDLPADRRVAAEADVGEQLAGERPLGRVWSAVCSLAADPTDDTVVRCAAVRVLAHAPAAAPNQLVRTFDDPDRRTRREAIAVLRVIGVAPSMEARLAEQLAACRGDEPTLALSNLAPTFGYDERIVAAYREAFERSESSIRAAAVRGLAMLGEMRVAVTAAADDDPAVRQEAAYAIGCYGTLEPTEIDAVNALARDEEPKVAKAATSARRLLGLRPIATTRRRAGAARPRDAMGWTTLLEAISARWLADRSFAAQLDDDVVRSGWLGRPPARAADIEALADRIGTGLPPSYVAFLLITDGFGRICNAIDDVLPASDVRPFVDDHADWIDAYAQFDDRLGELLGNAWLVSSMHDGVLLLHPDCADADGEWAASLFADWIPGLEQHGSFLDLVTALAGR